jgi:argininosuccinate lyase
LYLSERIEKTKKLIKEFIVVLADIAMENTQTVMPGYTHLQRAQPITLAQHLLAYCAMLMRDYDRLNDCKKRTLVLPLGSCALAGTTYPIDRFFVAEKLEMNGVCFNSLDGVSDRDFVIELSSDLSIIMAHLSRLAEEVISWCSWEFKFMEMDDAYSTGSSIMPQKKNPDLAELVRGKTGRVYGNLMSILTIIKGLPLAYNKDMQEDKEGVFDSCDTVDDCLTVFAAMMKTARFIPENMLNAAKKGFINATDVADYLTKKGMPFRTAYKLTGELVAKCIELNKTLDTLSIEEYKAASELFEEDIYEEVDIINCAFKRNSYGGPAKESVEKQLQLIKEFTEKN